MKIDKINAVLPYLWSINQYTAISDANRNTVLKILQRCFGPEQYKDRRAPQYLVALQKDDTVVAFDKKYCDKDVSTYPVLVPGSELPGYKDKGYPNPY